MCRRNHLWGWCLGCFGLGLLAARCLESGLVCTVLGIGLILGGLSLIRQK